MISTGGRLARELTRLGVDRARRGGLPVRAADLDAASLTELLGRRVTSVAPLDSSSGTTDRARLALGGAGVPASVFVKTAARAVGTRLFGGLARLGEVEVGFYRDLRPGLGLEAPAWLGGRFDRATGRFVIVLEDLAARAATFIDTRTPLTADQTAAAVDSLAELHVATLGRAHPPWVPTNAGDALLPLVSAFLGRLGGRVAAIDPILVTPTSRRLLGTYRRWAPLLEEGPRCVLHGDPHPGNLYLLGDRVGLLDWQAVRLGHPVRDVAYLLVLGMTAEDRRIHERDLLAQHGARLGAYDRDATWLAYRRMAAYAYVASVFTAGLGGLQGEQIADTGVRRAAAAVDDLGSAQALG